MAIYGNGEKRRIRRITLKDGLVLAFPEKNGQNPPVVMGKIYDISPLGIRFVTAQACAKDSQIALSLLTPDQKPVVKISGKVIRSIDKGKDECHIAVEFENPSDKLMESVEGYINLIKYGQAKAVVED